MENNIINAKLLEGLINNGLSFMPEVATALLNILMKIEREHALGAKSYERTEERKGYANGYKPKTLATSFGKIPLEIPQARGIAFYPGCIEKGERSERSLKLALAEMYIEGVSTRKVKNITEVLCGFEVSATQVSQAAKLLDEEFEKFRNRLLNNKYIYVTLDGTYIKVREDKQVVSECLLVAVAVDAGGRREVIGVDVKTSEAFTNWKEFLESLFKRGLKGVEMFTSDAHAGLKQALNEVYPGAKWQRCQFHFSRDAQHKATNQAQKTEIATATSRIFNQPTLESSQEEVKKVLEQFKGRNDRFVDWLDENVHEVQTVFSQPQDLRGKIRTSNSLERVNREIKKRTNVVGIFPCSESLLRLATGVLIEIHEDWSVASQPYMNLKDHKQLLTND